MTVTAAPAISDSAHDILDLRSRRRDGALGELCAFALRTRVVRSSEPVLEILRIRERIGSTALGKGVAIPHARSLAVAHSAVLIGRSARGVDWEADEPVRLVVLALAPGELADEPWLAFVARAAGLVRLQKHRQRLLSAVGPEAVEQMLRECGIR
jgi:PTS system nitrogen regulatory IIA component